MSTCLDGVGRHPQGSVPDRRSTTAGRRVGDAGVPRLAGHQRRARPARRRPVRLARSRSLRRAPPSQRRRRHDVDRDRRPRVPAQARRCVARQPDVAARGRVGHPARLGDRAGSSRRAGRAVVRHDPGRAVPFGRPGRVVAVRRRASGTCPARAKWFGGGYDDAGIHSICVDPRDPGRMRRRHLVRWGVAHRRRWRDRGRSPPTACAPASCRPSWRAIPTRRIRTASRAATADPDVLWCQHHCGIFRTTDNGEQLGRDREGRAVDVRVRRRRPPA